MFTFSHSSTKRGKRKPSNRRLRLSDPQLHTRGQVQVSSDAAGSSSSDPPSQASVVPKQVFRLPDTYVPITDKRSIAVITCIAELGLSCVDRDAGSVYGVSEADTVSRSQALLLADKGKKGKGSAHQGGMLITELAGRGKACSWERWGSPRGSCKPQSRREPCKEGCFI